MKTYKDIYQFPLRKLEYCSHVLDAKDQFVFQFEHHCMLEDEQDVLDAINGENTSPMKNELKFIHDKGMIVETTTNTDCLLIRGWGNLTGIGAHNLPAEEAANIQDTFAEYIVERLNKRG